MALEGMQIGHYRLLRLIGSGGMSEVYFAEDTRIPRQVAVKVVRGEATPYPNAQITQETARLFEREMKAITSLDHPNILPLYDFGEETIKATTVTYMVMPFRSEGSLVDWLYRHSSTGALPPQEVGYIVQEAANALQHAHNHHLMHLDVKPSNFLIRLREDRPQLPDVLLTDFGISRFNTATSTASQSIRGTPTYMAPEQWAGHPVPATDQYALAVMAYQLLTGIPPFQGNMHNMMYLHLQVQPPPPSSINPQLPAAIDAVFLRALAKKPEDRFPSVQVFAQALQQAFQNIFPPVAIFQREEDNPTVLAQPKKTLVSPPSTPNNEGILALSASSPTAPSSRLIRDTPSTTTPVVSLSQTAQPQRASWGTSALIILLALLLVVGSVGVTIYLLRSTSSNGTANNTTATALAITETAASTQSTTTAATQTALSTYPNVAGTYNGTIHNTLADIITSMSLSINQNSGQGSINGSFTVGPALRGNGPFTGAVDSSGNIQFTVQSTEFNEPLHFTGTAQSNGSMSGTYCSLDAQNQCDPTTGHGTWNVTRSS